MPSEPFDLCPSTQSLPDIAVIIPTRNRKYTLPRAIASVLAQTHQNFELIVIDDCSEDDTAAYLASIRDERFRWYRFDRWRRGNIARNHGVAMSTAPIVSFLDSDDYYLPNRLGESVAFFAAHCEVDVRISSFSLTEGSRSIACVNPEALFTRDELERYVMGYCLHLGGSAITMRRRAFNQIAGFDATLGQMQDRDLLLRVARTRGCASAAKIDWVKTRSSDSISRQAVGRIPALLAIRARHPVVSEKYAVLFRYLVAREILHQFLTGRFAEAITVLGEARRDVGMRALNLIRDYVLGKRQRRALNQEMHRRFGGV